MKLNYLIKEMKYYNKLGGLPRAMKKFLLSQTPLSKIVNRSFYRKAYLSRVRKKINLVQPTILQVENTNLCNAKCVMCPHIIMERKGRVMKLEDFQKIIDNVMKHYPIKRFTLTGFGDPLLDNKIMDKIGYVNKKYPSVDIELYTNASLMDEDLTNSLLNANIKKITFSINGVGGNYKKIMGLNYAKTKKNVLYFLKRKKELKKEVLTNMSLMILRDNEKDVKNFVNFWQPLSDSVRVYAPSNWAGKLKNFEIISPSPFKKKRWPCFVLWGNITVDVDANLIMCCRDYESRVKFGNLLKEDVKNIRDSKKYQDLLKKQSNFEFNTSICSTCDNSFDSSLDWLD